MQVTAAANNTEKVPVTNNQQQSENKLNLDSENRRRQQHQGRSLDEEVI